MLTGDLNPEGYINHRGWQYKSNGGWLQLDCCPFCNGGESGDRGTFAINGEDGNYKCQRASCGVAGSFRGLQFSFGDDPGGFKPKAQEYNAGLFTPKKKSYVLPVNPILSLSEKVMQYLEEERGLPKDVILRWKFSCDKWGNIALPFYQDGKLVLQKYRPAPGKTFDGPKTFVEKGGKPVLFGRDLCDPAHDTLLICFGDYDAATCDSAGVKNAVSVPFGDKALQWIDEEWEFLQNFKTIILWPDNDKEDQRGKKSGESAMHQIASRLDVIRVKIVPFIEGVKDPNDLYVRVLREEGREAANGAVQNAFNAAYHYPIDLLIDLADISDEEDVKEGPSYGFPSYDEVTAGRHGGELIGWGGKQGSGKTSAILAVAGQSVHDRSPIMVYSGEMDKFKLRKWFEIIAAGPDNLTEAFSEQYKQRYWYVKPELVSSIRDWYREMIYVYNKQSGATTPKDFFKAARTAIHRYGCKTTICDNLTKLLAKIKERDFLRAQADFTDEYKDLCVETNTDGHLLLHTSKDNRDEGSRIPTIDSIRGASEIVDLVDNLIIVWRVPESARSNYHEELKDVDTVLLALKTRDEGTNNLHIKMKFDKPSRRFVELAHPEMRTRQYGWNKPLIQTDWWNDEEAAWPSME